MQVALAQAMGGEERGLEGGPAASLFGEWPAVRMQPYARHACAPRASEINGERVLGLAVGMLIRVTSGLPPRPQVLGV